MTGMLKIFLSEPRKMKNSIRIQRKDGRFIRHSSHEAETGAWWCLKKESHLKQSKKASYTNRATSRNWRMSLVLCQCKTCAGVLCFKFHIIHEAFDKGRSILAQLSFRRHRHVPACPTDRIMDEHRVALRASVPGVFWKYRSYFDSQFSCQWQWSGISRGTEDCVVIGASAPNLPTQILFLDDVMDACG